MDAIHNIAEDVQRFAAEAGRKRPVFADVQRAINECARPTYTALTTQRDRDLQNGLKTRRRKNGRPHAAPQQRECSEPATETPSHPRSAGRMTEPAEEFHPEPMETNRVNGRDLAGV